jgi:hypothetical protein
MKIERFKIFEKLGSFLYGWVNDLHNSVDVDIPDYIVGLAPKTKLPEYENILIANSEEKTKELIQQKGLVKYQKYWNMTEELYKLENKMEDLRKAKDELYFEAANELIYKWQEDLFENDFDSFYLFFIEDSGYLDDKDDANLNDIHPDLLKKHYDDIKWKIEVFSDAKKYNL